MSDGGKLARVWSGRPFVVPQHVSGALEQVFAAPVRHVAVLECSRYARAHPGMCATTRPGRILLAIRGEAFLADPELVLHEYFHVLRQWQPGRLTRVRYVVESLRAGYQANRFEREARDFAAAEVGRYVAYLALRPGAVTDACVSAGSAP